MGKIASHCVIVWRLEFKARGRLDGEYGNTGGLESLVQGS